MEKEDLAAAGKAILELKNPEIIKEYFKWLPGAGDQDDEDEQAAKKHLKAVFKAALKAIK